MSEQTSTHTSGFRIAPVQEHVWTEQEGTALFRTECAIRYNAALTLERVQEAVYQLAQRYDILRTHYVTGAGRRFPLQVLPNSGADAPTAHVVEGSGHHTAPTLTAAEIGTLADEGSLLFRVELTHPNENESRLVLSLPTLSGDSQTLLLLAEELSIYLEGEEEDVDPDEILQYVQFAEWSRQFEEEPDEDAVDFWKEARANSVTAPPLNYRSAANTFDAQVTPVTFGTESSSLKRLAETLSISTEDLLAGLWGGFLSRLGGSEAVTLRCDLSGREFEELAEVVGLVARTVPVTFQALGANTDLTAQEFIRNAAQAVDDARENSDYYPFDEHETGAAQLSAFECVTLSDRTSEQYVVESLRSVKSRFVIKLSVVLQEDQLHSAEIIYNSSALDEKSVGTIATMFGTFVQGVLSDPSQELQSYRLLDADTLSSLQDMWNSSADSTHSDDVLARIEHVVNNAPSTVAVLQGEKEYTYSQLTDRANAIAERLLAENVQPNHVVAFALDRSFDAVATVLGIMKSGAGFLPIDPALPESRQRFMAEDSGAKIVLVSSTTHGAFQDSTTNIDLADIPEKPAGTVQSVHVDQDDLAYVIYTSGSTGTPKGCMLRRRNIASYIGWATDYYFQESKDGNKAEGHWPLFTSLSFDLTLTSIFCSLTRGKSVTVFGEGVEMTDILHDVFSPETAIDTVKMTPAQTTLLAGTGLKSTNVEVAILGGEQLQKEHVEALRKLNPRMQIFNEYGPTETTVGCTVALVDPEDERITIGGPVAGATVYAADSNGNLCAPYQVGELWVAGSGVSAGYLNRPELTSERFRDDLPFTNGQTAYRTGDLVRRYPDGTLEYLGRNDDQIKVRGYRIEPGEIKSRILGIEGISDTAVIGKTGKDGETELVAYYVLSSSLPSPESLKAQLLEILPNYMVPTFLIPVEKIPLTINGKVDVALLPDPDTALQTTEYIAPRNAVEQAIAQTWIDVLGVERVGVEDDFFQLGGHSLRAMRAMARINTELEVDLKVNAIFEHPTVAGLAGLISDSAGKKAAPIPTVAKKEFYELSDSQRRLWVLEQMENVGDAFHIAGAFDLSGSFDPQAFAAAFDSLIRRHEILRTTFHVVDNMPTQRVHEEGEPGIARTEFVDLSDSSDPAGAFEEEIRRLTLTPFDLEHGPLIRAGVLKVEEGRYTLCVAMHHIIADGWSVGIMIDELTALYEAHAAGQEPSLQPLRIQYKDFAAWQAEKLKDDSLAESRAYWLDKLSGATPLDLPLDFPRPQIKTYSGDVERFQVDPETYKKLSQYALESGASMFMVLLTLYKVLLSRYTGQDDITIGTAIAGRDHPDLDDQIGFYVNILALRDSVDSKESFADVLNNVRKTATEAYAHQTYPFDKLIDELGVERETGRSPLFDVFLVLQNNEAKELGFGDAVLTERHTPGTPGKYDLAFEFTEADGKLLGEVTYSTDVFLPQRIRDIIQYMMTLLDAVLSGADKDPISSLPLLSNNGVAELTSLPKEPKDFAEKLNNTLPQLIDEAALRNSEKVAVKGTERSFTYNELRKRSNGIAAYLRERIEHNNPSLKDASSSERRVAVLLPRSETVTLLYLSVLKAGAAYVPIDADYPAERVRRMLADCGASLVITDKTGSDFAPEGMEVIRVDQIETIKEQDDRPGPDGSPDDAAVIMYTSGSTGVPKGVIMQHRGLINTGFSAIQFLNADSESNILQFASISFDSSLFETHIALLLGTTLTVVPRSVIDDPSAFVAFQTEHSVTHAVLPPAYLATLNRQPMPTMKTILTAGEPPVLEDALFYAEHCTYVNGYGPSECAVCVSTFHVEPGKDYRTGIPIGVEMPNTHVVILDEHLNVLPPGLDGEICVVGAGVGPGYLNEEQTKKAFIEHPLFIGRRMYRTGDLGRRMFDGNISFRGRIDNQVKVRGHRVEPEETAAHLREHPDVSEATVITRKKAGESTQLIACLVPLEDGAADDTGNKLQMAKVRAWLSKRLPAYMVPSYFVEFAELPTTPNGKVDRKKLLVLTEEYISAEATQQSDEPSTEEERVLTQAVAATLGLKDVSREDNYFMIGGDSIKAIQLTWKLREEGYDLQVRDIFAHPRLADAAMHLQQSEAEIEEEAVEGRVPLSPIQMWFFEKYSVDHRNHFNQSVLLRKRSGSIDTAKLEEALNLLLDHHDMLRASFAAQAEATRANEPEQQLAEQGSVNVAVETRDLSDALVSDSAFNTALHEAHTRFTIEKAPLVSATVIRNGADEFLYLVVHHLVIDAVSWHILVGDFFTVYDSLETGKALQEVALPPKTASYKAWSAKLQELAMSQEIEEAGQYWRGLAAAHSNPGNLPVNQSASNNYGDTDTIKVALDSESTAGLLGTANETYNTESRDLLLTALGQALCSESNADSCVIGLEGHGRSVDQLSSVDTSRTVGWFTSLYPVYLEKGADAGSAIKKAKEGLRSIPMKGLSYGLCRYLAPNAATFPDLLAPAQIVLNYFGLETAEANNGSFVVEGEPEGLSNPSQANRLFDIEVIASVQEGELIASLSFSRERIKREQVEQLANKWMEELRALIQHCADVDAPELTPSDVDYDGLSIDDLDDILSNITG